MIGYVKKWHEFQHYKDRSPPWIKLQKKLLDDFEFSKLPLASRALAPLLWLLASEETDGSVRVDIDWLAFRLRWHEKEVSDGLSGLINKGFLIVDSVLLATCYQDAMPETETETEICTPNGVLVDDDEKVKSKANSTPVQKIVDLYHELLPTLRKVEKITSARRSSVCQRWRTDLPSLDAWKNYFTDVSRSPFLLGRGPSRANGKPWVCDFEWLCKEGNFAKVLEGKYHS